MTGDGRKRPQRTPPFCYQSKYHCYIATFEIIIFGVWKHSTCSCSTGSSREDRHPPLPRFFCVVFVVGGPANLCDSVATECLPAAECSAAAALAPSLHLPRSLAASLRTPTDWLPSSSFSFSSQEQLLQNWPTTLYWIYYFTTTLLLLLHQSLSSATSTSTLSSRLSPARITLSGDGVDWYFILLYFPLFFLLFLLELLVCILIFNFVLLWEVWWYCCCYHERLLYFDDFMAFMQCSSSFLSLSPPLPPRQNQRVV